MRVAVVGAGAVGSVVGGLLARAGQDVTLVGRPAHVAAIQRDGLVIEQPSGPLTIHVKASERLDFTPDLALLAVKITDLAAAVEQVRPLVTGVPVLTMQNGVRADRIAAGVLGEETILSCVVMMAATYLTPGRVTYARPGSLLLGVPFGPTSGSARRTQELLDQAVPTRLTDTIRGAHWAKLIVNENNALPAITGWSVQQVSRDPWLSRLATLMMKEAVATIRAAGIRLASLPELPAPVLRATLALPTPLATRAVSLMSRSLGSTPVLGSTRQSIERGRATEIDYLNGEVVALGRHLHRPTPYNEAVVQLVHRVERTGRYLPVDELLAALPPL
ncbi:MAG TPA: 2-dehydropantoate 2-reductase [Actinomycetes bacterium]